MDLLAFERKLDATIMRKRLDIQEALKRPQKIKRKLRIFISHTFFPGIVKRNISFLFISGYVRPSVGPSFVSRYSCDLC